MRIGELARQAGLRTSAIRYYESLGILKSPARRSGRREYDATALDTLQLVQAARQAGFTLKETRLFITMVQGHTKTRSWRPMAEHKLAELDATIAHLRKARSILAGAIDCTCAGRAKDCQLVKRSGSAL